MKKITQHAFDQLINGATVIEKDSHGLKVLETNDKHMIKIFRRKRFFSTALFKPYAQRFVDNAHALHALNIPTIDIHHLYNCPAMRRQIVVYQKLNGELLRDVFQQKKHTHLLSQLFARFVANLHKKGVYFRSIHLKNVLVLDDGNLGLIDISDMKIKPKKLSLPLRLRNFAHMLRYPEDKKIIKNNFDDFLNTYAELTELNPTDKAHVKTELKKLTSSLH